MCVLDFGIFILLNIRRYKHRRTINADGNMTAQHMIMKNPALDVTLADGLSYKAEEDPYQGHCSQVHEFKQVEMSLLCISLEFLLKQLQRSTCNNHKAVKSSSTNKKNLDATGIGGCACGRHGCFIPTCIVDFQKGEQ